MDLKFLIEVWEPAKKNVRGEFRGNLRSEIEETYKDFWQMLEILCLIVRTACGLHCEKFNLILNSTKGLFF